jgi:hypothetical protein
MFVVRFAIFGSGQVLWFAFGSRGPLGSVAVWVGRDLGLTVSVRVVVRSSRPLVRIVGLSVRLGRIDRIALRSYGDLLTVGSGQAIRLTRLIRLGRVNNAAIGSGRQNRFA